MGLLDNVNQLKADLKVNMDVVNTVMIPTGSPVLDSILGGGFAKAKFTQVYSESGVGKSTIVLQFCRNACKMGLKIAYLDSEGGLNDDLIDSMGLREFVDVNFFIFPISLFEESEKVIDSLIAELDFVIVDSLTFLIPQKLLESSVGDVLPGLQSRVESLWLQKYKYMCTKHNCGFIFISQTRTSFNFRGQSTVDSAGGKATKFSMDVRLYLRKTGDLKKRVKTLNGVEEIVYGANVALMCKKNRFTSPFIEGHVSVVYGKGISNLLAYSQWLIKNKYMQLNGSWYVNKVPGYEESPKLQGLNGINKWVKEHAEEVAQLVAESGGFELVDKSQIAGDDN